MVGCETGVEIHIDFHANICETFIRTSLQINQHIYINGHVGSFV